MTDDDNANVMRGIVLPGQRTLLLVIIIIVKEIDTMTWECQLRTAADRGDLLVVFSLKYLLTLRELHSAEFIRGAPLISASSIN